MEEYRAAMLARLQNYEVDEHGCHIWQGYIDRNGYGRVYDPAHGGLYWVHRVAHEIYKGPIPPKHEIDHECQRTACINPKCIVAVTKPEHLARTYQRLGKDRLHLAVAEMRRIGATYAEIAEALGLAGKSSAKSAVDAAVRKGLVNAEEVPPARRLSESEREDIRDLHVMGVPQTVIAECYGVDSSQVSRICSGRTSGWK